MIFWGSRGSNSGSVASPCSQEIDRQRERAKEYSLDRIPPDRELGSEMKTQLSARGLNTFGRAMHQKVGSKGMKVRVTSATSLLQKAKAHERRESQKVTQMGRCDWDGGQGAHQERQTCGQWQNLQRSQVMWGKTRKSEQARSW